jgi:hypothetical protein
MIMKRIFLLLTPLFMVSCGTYYKSPEKVPGKTAIIKSSSNRKGMFDWSNYTVMAIDDLPISYATALATRVKELVVKEGTHNIVIEGSFGQGMGSGGPYNAMCDIDMKFIGGRSYVANGMRKGSKLRMWIEDSQTGKAASQIVEVPYQNTPQSYVMPIILPSN